MNIISLAMLPVMAFLPSQPLMHNPNYYNTVNGYVLNFDSGEPEQYYYSFDYSPGMTYIETDTNKPNEFILKCNYAYRFTFSIFQGASLNQLQIIERKLSFSYKFENVNVDWSKLQIIRVSNKNEYAYLGEDGQNPVVFQFQNRLSYAISFDGGPTFTHDETYHTGFIPNLGLDNRDMTIYRNEYYEKVFYGPMLDEAFQAGGEGKYEEGRQDGYEAGYEAGKNATLGNPFERFFKSIVGVVDDCLQIEIFPSFKLWYFVGIPIIFTAVLFVFKLFR